MASVVAKPAKTSRRPSVPIAHIARPHTEPLRSLCGQLLRGVKAPTAADECVVCTEMWRERNACGGNRGSRCRRSGAP
jgi:hypothetical protein